MNISTYCSSTTKAISDLIRGSHSVPSRLRALTLDFKEVDEEVLLDDDSVKEEDGNVTTMRLGWVLGQLQTLHYLITQYAAVNKLLWMPPLSQLRHLSLSFYIGISASLGKELCLLTHLQTLLLYGLYPPYEEWIEMLDLRPQTQLRSACLCDVFCKICKCHLSAKFTYARMSSRPPLSLVQACDLHWLHIIIEQIGRPEDDQLLVLERKLLNFTKLSITTSS